MSNDEGDEHAQRRAGARARRGSVRSFAPPHCLHLLPRKRNCFYKNKLIKGKRLAAIYKRSVSHGNLACHPGIP